MQTKCESAGCRDSINIYDGHSAVLTDLAIAVSKLEDRLSIVLRPQSTTGKENCLEDKEVVSDKSQLKSWTQTSTRTVSSIIDRINNIYDRLDIE